MVLAGGINRIYVEYIQTFLHVWQCQNGYAFPGGLEVASDPKASPIEQEKKYDEIFGRQFCHLGVTIPPIPQSVLCSSLCEKDYQVSDQVPDSPIARPGYAEFIESGHQLKHLLLKLLFDVTLICA